MSFPVSLTLPPWVTEFFDATYASAALVWSREKEDDVAMKVEKALSLSLNSTVFDQCCGVGGLARGLARRGHEVTAIDQSQAYITQGEALAVVEGLALRWQVGDAGCWQPPEKVDAAVSWHSSIGYGGKPGGERMLSSLRSAVCQNGYWLVEILNRDHMDLHFQVHHIFKSSVAPWGEVEVHRTSRWECDILLQDWSYRVNGVIVWERQGTFCWHPRCEHLEAWIHAQGDQIVAWLDTETGAPLSSVSPRLMVVVKKGKQ